MNRRYRSSLGFKLPLSWRDEQAHGRLPAFPGDLLTHLRECGFDYVEFGFGLTLEDNSEAEALLEREAAECARAGLGVSMHPGPGRRENETAAWFGPTPADQPGVEPVLRAGRLAAGAAGGEVPVVLHPAQYAHEATETDVEALRAEMVRRSRLFFAALEQAAGQADPRIRPVVEHQLPTDPGEPLIRVGDTWHELMQTLADCDLGACWDTGHYILGIERYGQEPEPPQRFLRRVTHVHLHDVVEGRDHRPLTPESKRPRRYLELLGNCGFAGHITLEYAADGVREAGGPEAVLREAPRVLTDRRP